MELEEVINKRHATRKFKDEKISKELLEKMLELGRLSPSAKNLQPTRIYVIESSEGLEKLDKATPCRYNAPTVLMVCANISEAWKKDDYSSYEMDASIMATHLMLAATNLKIANIWVEMFQKDILIKEFNLEKDIIPICLIPIGYEADDCPPSPNHLNRKPLEEIVKYI